VITYNNIIATFEAFANNHLQIRRFSHGLLTVADLDKDGEYPVLHVVPGTMNADNLYQYSVDVYVFDKPRDKDEFDKSDYQREVISDCTQILNDVLADILNGGNVFLFDEIWSVEMPTGITPFIEQQQHTVTGVQATLTITVAWGIDACELPLTPVTPPAPVVCESATIEINGVELTTVASGGLLDITVEYQNGTPVGTLSGGDTVTIPNPPTFTDAIFELNNTQVGTAGSGVTLDVPVEYENGSPVGSLISGVWTIPDPITCADATVENSDQSYTDTVASGDTLVLPDTEYNFYLDGVLVDTQTIPSIKTETFNIVWQ
jgi:hypothetical protein